MANAKPILYGVSDFVLMRTEGKGGSDPSEYVGVNMVIVVAGSWSCRMEPQKLYHKG